MHFTANVRTTWSAVLHSGMFWGGWLASCGGLTPLPLSGAEPAAKLVQSLDSPSVSRRLQVVWELVDHEGPDSEVVAGLIRALVDEDVRVRYVALTGLERRGASARVAVPLVVRILQLPERDSSLRVEALQVLGSLGGDAISTVDTVARSLYSGDSLEAVTAASALARILPRDHRLVQAAVSVAVRGLQDKRSEVRSAAVVALGEMGPAAVTAVNDWLTGAVATKDPELLIAGGTALEMMGPAAAPAVPGVLRLLAHAQERVVLQGVRALGAIGPAAKSAVPTLQKRLEQKETSRTLKLQIVNALGEMAPAAADDAVPPLIQMLADEEDEIRRAAVRSLGRYGPAAKSAVPGLIQALQDKSTSVALHAAEALGRIGAEAVPDLAGSLHDEKLRMKVLVILSDLGPAAKGAVPALVQVLHDPQLEVRRQALVTLAQIGPEAKAATPALIRILQSDKPDEPRPGAAYALGKIGAKEAVPLLLQRLQQKSDPNLSMICAWSLVTLEPENPQVREQAVPQLIQAIKHPWGLARREAVLALSRLGAGARPALPALIELLEDADPLVRNEALILMAEFGGDARSAVPRILSRLSDAEPRVRYSACFALGRIGPPAQDALPALIRNLREPDDFLRIASAWAMVHIAPRGEQSTRLALPWLIRGLKYPDPQVRVAVLEATQQLQPSSSPGRKVLQEAIEMASRDTDEAVRVAATAALNHLKR